MGIKELIAQYHPIELYKQLKRLLSDSFNELDLQKVEYLKPVHQERFRQIRLEYIDLLNVGRRFCEESTPPLQYSIEKLQRRDEINYRQLYQLIEKMDPEPVILQCEVLEKKITAFNDEIKLDPDYKNKGWKSVAKSIIAGVFVVGSIVAAVCLPFLIPLEMAFITGPAICLPFLIPLPITFITGAAIAFGATIPGLIQFFKGLAATKLQDDIQLLIKKLNQANADISGLKKRMSELIEHQGSIKLRLNDEDATSLLNFYQTVAEDIKEIKEICTKSVALF
jgi:hypothetical protein